MKHGQLPQAQPLPPATNPAPFAALQEEEVTRWRRVVQAGRITVD